MCSVFLGSPLEGALLLTLFASAHAASDSLTSHARGGLAALWASVPDTAVRVRISLRPDGSPDFESAAAPSATVAAASVPVGSLIYVAAGGQVLLDSVVFYGSAHVKLHHLTGESAPTALRVGDAVPAGASEADGPLVLRTSRFAGDSTPARIARLTAAAQARRPRATAWIDAAADGYSAALLVAFVAVALLGPPLFHLPLLGPGGSLYHACAVLSAAAPCALLMSPLAYVVALGAASARGILVHGGGALDTLAEVGGVCVDKTGVLAGSPCGGAKRVGVPRVAAAARPRPATTPHGDRPTQDGACCRRVHMRRPCRVAARQDKKISNFGLAV